MPRPGVEWVSQAPSRETRCFEGADVATGAVLVVLPEGMGPTSVDLGHLGVENAPFKASAIDLLLLVEGRVPCE